MKHQHLAVFILFLYSCAFTLISCNNQQQNNTPATDNTKKIDASDIAVPGSFSNQTTLTFDSTFISSFFKTFPLLNNYQKKVDSFYANRDYAFAWFDKDGLIEPAANLENHLENLDQEGLTDTILYHNEFTDLMSNDGLDSSNKPSAYTELMLTAQYFFYADKVWKGFDKKQVESVDWYLPKKRLSYTRLLDSLVNGKDILNTAPVYRQYGLLKDYLKKYKNIEAAGGFPKVIATKKSYKKGDSSQVLVTIRQILLQTGDLSQNNNSAVFDDQLLQGVRSYQQRMGLKDDGIIGSSFIADINTPVQKRIGQIMVNMERSRWVPVELTKNYIVINIPEFKLHVFEDDKPIWSMNVVVGQPAHKTVIFNGDIKYVVFSPYWNVPTSIKNKEILPAMRRNPHYLTSHNMEWNGGNIRQKPGPNNSLGLVKFLFPNSHSIYLHDTPAKSLFGESNRAFSHGCIRLAEPQKLAEYLLRNDSSWSHDKIVAAMNAGKEKYVTLKEQEPVFIAYFTAWVSPNGKINFRNDVYKRDDRIAEMLFLKK